MQRLRGLPEVTKAEMAGSLRRWKETIGDLDLIVGSGSGIRLYRNGGGSNHWLKVRLRGADCNRSAIGARVTVRWNGREQIREIEGGMGTASQNSLDAEFGFGQYKGTVEVIIRWPCGKVESLPSVGLDKLLDVAEKKE